MSAADLIAPNFQWLELVNQIIHEGDRSAPRGQSILELPHKTIELPLDRCVITLTERKLNYRFMTAEALWIVAGRRDLAFLTQYNKKMAEYSDDGFTLYGAYGPRYVAQRDYVVNKLLEDRDTRQATLTLWRPNPHASKDIPCTVAVDFKIRRDVLNCHIFMRSSDIYLGLPYDMFSFSMIALDILHRFNAGSPTAPASPGLLYITAASSHIYERDVEKMNHVIAHPDGFIPKRTPTSLYALDGLGPERILEDILNESRVPWWNA